MPSSRRRQQRRRRSFAGHVADDEAELAGRADRRSRRSRRRPRGTRPTRPAVEKNAPSRSAGRQQRLLNRRRDLQLLLELRLVERFAVEARVLDRERRFAPTAYRAPPAPPTSCSAPRSRLSRYSTPMISSAPLLFRPLRRSAPGAAACTARGGCRAPRCRCAAARGRRRAGPRRSSAGRWRRRSPGILRLVSNVRPGSVTLPRDAPA